MNYKIIGKNIEVTDGIKQAVLKSMDKLSKYFKFHDSLECRVLVRTYPKHKNAKIEVTIPLKNNLILRAEEKDDDLYKAIILVENKLEKQLKTIKSKKLNSHNLNDIILDTDKNEPICIVKEKDISPEEMDIEEAIIKMESLGHSFFIFIDKYSHLVNVVYKRLDNDYGTLRLIN